MPEGWIKLSCSARCPPCKMIAPVFEGLAEKHHTKADFVKCDVDKAQDVAQRFSISAMYVFASVFLGLFNHTIFSGRHLCT